MREELGLLALDASRFECLCRLGLGEVGRDHQSNPDVWRHRLDHLDLDPVVLRVRRPSQPDGLVRCPLRGKGVLRGRGPRIASVLGGHAAAAGQQQDRAHEVGGKNASLHGSPSSIIPGGWPPTLAGSTRPSPTRRGWRPPCWRPGVVQGVLECLEELGWIRPEALRAAGRHEQRKRSDRSRAYRDHGFLAGRGGALYSSLSRFRRRYGPPGLTFAAHIALYPGCLVRYVEDDDVTAVLPCTMTCAASSASISASP